MLSFKVKEKLSDEELENLRIYVIGAAEAASEIEYDYERHMHHTFRASYEIKKPERTVQCKPLFTIEIEGGYQYDVE